MCELVLVAADSVGGCEGFQAYLEVLLLQGMIVKSTARRCGGHEFIWAWLLPTNFTVFEKISSDKYLSYLRSNLRRSSALNLLARIAGIISPP